MRSSLSFAIAAFFVAAQMVAAEPARFLSAYNWSSGKSEFGGISALEIVNDGDALIALSDRGFLLTATISRSGSDGRIDAVGLQTIVPLAGPDGVELPEFERDSEGLALSSDGSVYISFEAVHGIGKFNLDGRMLSDGLLRHPDFLGMQLNSSLEALAIDKTGRLCTAPERSGRLLRPFPVYCLERGKWTQPFSVPRSEDFLLVGMDFGPDGRLYVLERALRSIFLATRVRRFDVAPGALTDELLLLETTSGTHDNLEGISVWRDSSGALRMSLVSDDNYNVFQRTEIVEYLLP